MSQDLILAATSLDPIERADAIRALGRQRRAEGVQALLFALATADAATAGLAVDALARIGPPAEIPVRQALAQDVDEVVRGRLQDALTRLTQNTERS